MSAAAIIKPHSTVLPDAIDFSEWFMPQELSPLYFTDAYARLTDAQRLRYNQLNALYFNEQTMFFEKSLARNVLGYFLSDRIPDGLKSGLKQFLTEEEAHTEMFRRLNRRCAQELYDDNDFYFIRVPPAASRLLDALSKRPRRFAALLWLMHLQEERASYFGRVFLNCDDTLEPHFLAAQRKHLADEIGHIRWDEDLLDLVWPALSPFWRRLNVRLLSGLVGEYFTTPKRSAVRVVAKLVEEFPGLRPRQNEIVRQLRALGGDATYRRSLYSPQTVPHTFKRFDDWPEFSAVTTAMPGYVPGGN